MTRRLALAALCLTIPIAAHADSKAWTAASKILPPDMQVVMGANVATIRNSTLFAKVYPTLLAKLGSDAQAHLDAFKTTCNLDPLAKLDSFVMAIDANQVGVAVVSLRAASQKDIEACFQKASKADGKQLTVTVEGKLTKYATDKDTFYLRWISKDTFAMATEPDNKDTLVKVTAGGDKAMRLLVGKVKTSSALWFISNQEQDLSQFGAKATRIYGTADFKAGNVSLDAHLVLDKPAADIAASANQQLDALKAGGSLPPALTGLVSALKISAVRQELVIDASMAEKDLAEIATTVLGLSK